ncbi:MAG: hypothetical protein HKN22_03330 [Bacteroidia bacterium]|nr:hypothetical protein [Bacteroidia bacterium]
MKSEIKPSGKQAFVFGIHAYPLAAVIIIVVSTMIYLNLGKFESSEASSIDKQNVILSESVSNTTRNAIAEVKAVIAHSDQIKIVWTSRYDISENYFAVEKSIDGMSWVKMATALDWESTLNGYKYKVSDEDPIVGTSYYRVRKVDFDGNISYSDIITVEFEE